MMHRLSPFRISRRIPLDARHRRRVQKRAATLMGARPQYHVAVDFGSAVVLSMLWVIAIFTIMPFIDGGPIEWVTFFAAPLVFGGVIVLGWIWLFVKGRPFVRQALVEAGYEYCHACGYDLRGAPPSAHHCPECGAARRYAAPATPCRARRKAAAP